MIDVLKDLTFHIQTFGCQMNKHDSERVRGMLDASGACEVATVEEADVVVFMTCCVREAADTRLKGQASSLKNVPMRPESPLARRIVAIGGCIGQRDSDALFADLPHVAVVFGTHNVADLPRLLTKAIESGEHVCETLEEGSCFSADLPTKRDAPWAAWLPITYGCDNFCTYCIVPYVRGRERSRSLEDIVAEAERYVAEGVREITLLGQNVNSYGRDRYGKPQLARVLRAVDATGVERLRFVTSHPKDLSPEVIACFSELRSVMPALHLPVQSGSDRILKAMNRRYTASRYRRLVEELRGVCPDIALSTDVIVGFPGETDADFEDTYRLVEEIGYAQAFTFIYSERAGTPAASMEDKVPRDVVQKRFDALVDLVQAKAYEFNQGERGRVVDVLVEGASKRDERMICGKTPKNQTVHAPLPQGADARALAGDIVRVRITEPKTWYLQGELA